MKKIKVSLKFSVKEGLRSKKIYQRVHEQKLVSVTFEDAASRAENRYRGPQPDSGKSV